MPHNGLVAILDALANMLLLESLRASRYDETYMNHDDHRTCD